MINIFLVEGHNIVRSGIKSLLESDNGLRVIAEATNGVEALKMRKELEEAQVLLTDINMEGIDGITLTKELSELFPNLSIIILSMLDGNNYVFDAFKSGVKAYLLKNVSADELVFCIKHVAAGGTYFCSELSMKMLMRAIKGDLYKRQILNNSVEFNERELEIINMVADGLTNQEIADKLFVSKRTVEGYRQHLIDKTKSKNTASLIKYGISRGYIKL